jgi:anti-sigma factor (TIGR02949 family)
MTKDNVYEMPCHEVVQLLWEYLDGELDDALRKRVREHLVLCDHCRDHFTFEGEFLRTVGNLIDEPIDTASLRTRILKSLELAGYGEEP